jgi:hypothetical protein
MILTHRFLLFLLSLVILLPAAAAAAIQEATQSDPAQAAKAAQQKVAERKAAEQKALAMLEEVVGQVQSLKLPENRIRVQAKAAEMLWTRDEERARALFMEAAGSLGALLARFDPGDPSYQQFIQAPSQLRHEMMQIISQRDPKLALDFLRATRLPSRPQSAAHGQPDPEVQLELSLGVMISATDPKLALQLAEESLAKGLSSQLTGILSQLAEKDREAAARLASSILRKLRTENFLANYEVVNAAFGMLNLAAQPAMKRREEGASARKPALVEESAARELVEMMIAAVLGASDTSLDTQAQHNTRNLLNMLQSNMALLEKYAPSRVAALQRKTAELDKLLDPRSKAWREIQTLSQQGTVETMLEAIGKMPAETRGEMYRQAAWKAFNEGNPERARQIITENVDDPAQRHWMLADFDRQAFWRAVNEGKLEESRQYLSRIRSVEERAGMISQLAANAFSKGHKKLALQLLDEARSLLGPRAENQNQFQAQLQIVGAYAQADPARAFEMLEPIGDQLNELIAASAVLDGFQGQGGFREGEMIMSHGSFAASLTHQYAERLASLASVDFDRAKSAADRLQREEARLTTYLIVIQRVLNSQVDIDMHVRERGQQHILINGRYPVTIR